MFSFDLKHYTYAKRRCGVRRIAIGSFIARKRKERGITQEELAGFLGVSKPAVSKWESGQSYPDILLLPVIASYFGVSVDALLGYEADLSKEEIRRVYSELTARFVKEDFETVYRDSETYVKSYYSCWLFLFSMAQLWINHAPLAGSAEKSAAVIEHAAELLERIEKDCPDPTTAKMALSLRGFCLLALGRAAEVIKLLGDTPMQEMSTELLLSKAYATEGDLSKAEELVEICQYRNLMGLFGAFSDRILLCANDPEKTATCIDKALGLATVFNLRELHPSVLFTFLLTAATVLTGQKQYDRALELLELYAETVTSRGVFPLKLKGSAFFDRLDSYFESFNLGTAVPRSNVLIARDIKDAVVGNPSFSALAGEERYRHIVWVLSHWEVEE